MFFTAVVRVSSNWALALLTFSLHLYSSLEWLVPSSKGDKLSFDSRAPTKALYPTTQISFFASTVSCAFKTSFLKSYQPSSTPLPCRKVSQGILSISLLNRPKSAQQKSKVAILLTPLLAALRIENSIISLSFYPKHSPTITFSTSPSMLKIGRSKRAPSPVGSFTSCVGKLCPTCGWYLQTSLGILENLFNCSVLQFPVCKTRLITFLLNVSTESLGSAMMGALQVFSNSSVQIWYQNPRFPVLPFCQAKASSCVNMEKIATRVSKVLESLGHNHFQTGICQHLPLFYKRKGIRSL